MDKGLISGDERIRPCRPGWATRSAGGFSWVFESEEACPTVGSQYTVRECAMAPILTVHDQMNDVFLFPESEEHGKDKNDGNQGHKQ